MAKFVRFQSPQPDAAGVHVGIFRLLNTLGWDGLLNDEEETYRERQNEWFENTFPDPSTVDVSAYGCSPRAVAWFKAETAQHLIVGLHRHFEILDKYGVPWERVESPDPGRIVYEDEWQVVVAPN